MQDQVCLGIFADAQYSSTIDDREGLSFSKVPSSLIETLERFRAANVTCVCSLGDLVESSSAPSDAEAIRLAENEYKVMLDVIAKHTSTSGIASCLPVMHHTLGNHCCLRGREFAVARLRLGRPAYYSVDYRLFRLVVLDAMDQAVDPTVASSKQANEAARAWLRDHCDRANAVIWNGGCSDEQLAWLDVQFQTAAASRQHVVLCTHIPICEWATSARHLLYNHEAVLDVVDRGARLLTSAAGRSCVCLAGHFHAGGFSVRNGVPHVTVPAIVQHGVCGLIVRVGEQSIHLEAVGAAAAVFAAEPHFAIATAKMPDGPFQVISEGSK